MITTPSSLSTSMTTMTTTSMTFDFLLLKMKMKIPPSLLLTNPAALSPPRFRTRTTLITPLPLEARNRDTPLTSSSINSRSLILPRSGFLDSMIIFSRLITFLTTFSAFNLFSNSYIHSLFTFFYISFFFFFTHFFKY